MEEPQANGKTDESKKSEKVIQLVTFFLANEKYGIDIMQTQEIYKMQRMTPIPNSLEFVEGVINLRGKIIPVINLKKRFNLIGGEEHEGGIIVLRLGELDCGIIIDKIAKVIYISADKILPPPPIVAGFGREYITGVARDDEDKLLIILDINRILSYEEIENIKASKESVDS